MFDWLCKVESNVILYSEKVRVSNLQKICPSIIVSYNYASIISEDVIRYMNQNIINLHISYLPYNRGAQPNFWSFIENTPKGVTVHKIDKGLDTGNILFQKELLLDETKETFSTSYQHLHEEIQKLFMDNWVKIKNNHYEEYVQSGRGSYHTMKDFYTYTENKQVDWNEKIIDYKERNHLI